MNDFVAWYLVRNYNNLPVFVLYLRKREFATKFIVLGGQQMANIIVRNGNIDAGLSRFG